MDGAGSCRPRSGRASKVRSEPPAVDPAGSSTVLRAQVAPQIRRSRQGQRPCRRWCGQREFPPRPNLPAWVAAPSWSGVRPYWIPPGSIPATKRYRECESLPPPSYSPARAAVGCCRARGRRHPMRAGHRYRRSRARRYGGQCQVRPTCRGSGPLTSRVPRPRRPKGRFDSCRERTRWRTEPSCCPASRAAGTGKKAGRSALR